MYVWQAPLIASERQGAVGERHVAARQGPQKAGEGGCKSIAGMDLKLETGNVGHHHGRKLGKKRPKVRKIGKKTEKR
jgi:hypothetical protein